MAYRLGRRQTISVVHDVNSASLIGSKVELCQVLLCKVGDVLIDVTFSEAVERLNLAGGQESTETPKLSVHKIYQRNKVAIALLGRRRSEPHFWLKPYPGSEPSWVHWYPRESRGHWHAVMRVCEPWLLVHQENEPLKPKPRPPFERSSVDYRDEPKHRASIRSLPAP